MVHCSRVQWLKTINLEPNRASRNRKLEVGNQTGGMDKLVCPCVATQNPKPFVGFRIPQPNLQLVSFDQ